MAAWMGLKPFFPYGPSSMQGAQGDTVAEILRRANTGPEFLFKNPKLQPPPAPQIEDRIEHAGSTTLIEGNASRNASVPATTAPRVAPTPTIAPTSDMFASPAAEFAAVPSSQGMNPQSSSKPTGSGTNWGLALQGAQRLFGNVNKKEEVTPPKPLQPSPMRANPISQGLPDPVLFALFGRPI